MIVKFWGHPNGMGGG